MHPLLYSLFAVPVLVSLLILLLPAALNRILILATAFYLSAASVILLITGQTPLLISLPESTGLLIEFADAGILLFCIWVAISRKSVWVGLLTVLQMVFFIYLYINPPVHAVSQLIVDPLSILMLLLVNIISSIIAVFAVKYMEDEPCSAFRKKYFIALLFAFISVMNLLVVSNSLEYFFLFFELTTLASFLLIGFRRDPVSDKNAVTALWMNQIGAVGILFTLFWIQYNQLGEASFTNIISGTHGTMILLPLAGLSIAALIKGAQMPFSNWLLGAMVAPTPVSALLHSSTMVKIAPFVILRLSPALAGTKLSYVIMALTAMVFLAASVSALSQTVFKRILAWSTIALLALMILLAAAGTPVTLVTAMILMLFHGVSKCMLFLNAGVLERNFHYKETTQMNQLAEQAPFTVFAITTGFLSLLLPPFGAFIGKWFSLEALSNWAFTEQWLGVLLITILALGGVVLTILYFKVMGILLARSGSRDLPAAEKSNPWYKGSMLGLLGILFFSIAGFMLILQSVIVPAASALLQVKIPVYSSGMLFVIGSLKLPWLPLVITFLLLPVGLFFAQFLQFRRIDRVKEYNCGEKINYNIGSFYFSTDAAMPWLTGAGILFFAALIAVAL